MKPQEKINDKLVERQLELMRKDRSLGRKFVDAVAELIDEIKAFLVSSKLPKRLQTIAARISDFFSRLPQKLRELLSPTQQIIEEWASMAIILNAGVSADIASKTVAGQRVQAILASTMVNGQLVDEALEQFTDSIKRQVLAAVRTGATTKTMTQIAGEIGALTDLNRNHAQTLARTLTNAITNQARNDFYQTHDELIQGYTQTSTLDGRTTKVCAVRDNLSWDLDKKPAGHNQSFKLPPLHYNCRSIMLPWLKSDSSIPKSVRDKIPKSTRASIDGQVESDLTFEKWVERKPKAFQEKWFGKGRYELWREKKITFGELVDSDGRQRTLAELEK